MKLKNLKVLGFVLGGTLFVSSCASFLNPVTTTRLATIESSYGIALSAAVAYRDACNRRVIDWAKCTSVVRQLRSYDRTVKAALAAAQIALKAGDTLTILSSLTAAQDALSVFQNYEAMNGVH